MCCLLIFHSYSCHHKDLPGNLLHMHKHFPPHKHHVHKEGHIQLFIKLHESYENKLSIEHTLL